MAKGPACIAACALQSDGVLAYGAAFLRRVEGRTWLVTAAQLLPNAAPNAGFGLWAEKLMLIPADRKRVDIPLFVEDMGARRPLFRYYDDEGRFADVIARELSADYLAAKALGQAQVYDAAIEPFPLEAGDALTGHGFPDPGDGQWPAYPPGTVRGTFHSADGLTLGAEMPVKTGFAGGPALDAKGRLVGMIIGDTAGLTRLIPVDFIDGLLG
jgi:hypothetical protein